MNRKTLISLHLILAAFFAPILIITGLSGGLYLIGEKGEVKKEIVYQGLIGEFNFTGKSKRQQVREFIRVNKLKQDFEYLKGDAKTFVTRPTSKQHLMFKVNKKQLIVTKRTPNFIASIVELHKGHGSRAFKTFQKFMAIGLFLILVSGLFLGLTSPLLRNKTLLISGIGLLSFLFFAVF